MRDSGTVSSVLTRNAVKTITLALGQNNSFSRGFDKILQMLLVSYSFLAAFSSVKISNHHPYKASDFRQA